MHTAVRMWILVLAICKLSKLGADGKVRKCHIYFTLCVLFVYLTCSSSWLSGTFGTLGDTRRRGSGIGGL